MVTYLLTQLKTKSYRWNLFRQQIISGDLYRKENFREAFPELWEILKFDFLYNKELENAKQNPTTYGSLEKGKVI